MQPTEDTDGFEEVSYRDTEERKDEIAREPGEGWINL